jgi:hypothetical protein
LEKKWEVGLVEKKYFYRGNKVLRQCLLALLVKARCRQDAALGSVDGKMMMGSGV